MFRGDISDAPVSVFFAVSLTLSRKFVSTGSVSLSTRCVVAHISYSYSTEEVAERNFYFVSRLVLPLPTGTYAVLLPKCRHV